MTDDKTWEKSDRHLATTNNPNRIQRWMRWFPSLLLIGISFVVTGLLLIVLNGVIRPNEIITFGLLFDMLATSFSVSVIIGVFAGWVAARTIGHKLEGLTSSQILPPGEKEKSL